MMLKAEGKTAKGNMRGKIHYGLSLISSKLLTTIVWKAAMGNFVILYLLPICHYNIIKRWIGIIYMC